MLLELIPAAIFHAVFIVGILGIISSIFLSMIPFISQYRALILVISLVLYSVGLWAEGAIVANRDWSAKLATQRADAEKKIAELEQRSSKVTIKVVDRLVKEISTVTVAGEEVVKYIDREVVKYDNSCKIPASVITAHNLSAKTGTSK